MRQLFLFVSTAILLCVNGAQNFQSGARFAGMANSCVVLQDIWSVSHNQAGLAYLPNTIFSVHHENHFLIKEYSLATVAFAIPTKPGTIAASYSYFGYAKYHESKVGLAYSKSFGEKISCGIQLDYFSKFILNEYGQGRAIVVEGGLLYKPVKNFSVGFHLFNPNRAKISEYSNERLPTIIRFGLGYKFLHGISITAETEKQTHINPYYKLGMEYTPSKMFFFRAGVSNNPMYAYSFGIGVAMRKLTIDIASSFHQILGFTSFLSLTYSL